MARLIDIGPAVRPLPQILRVRPGDLIKFAATGGDVKSGETVIRRLGVFRTSALGPDGGVLSPEGAPDAVFFLVCNPGSAVLRIVSGDPWGKFETNLIEARSEA